MKAFCDSFSRDGLMTLCDKCAVSLKDSGLYRGAISRPSERPPGKVCYACGPKKKPLVTSAMLSEVDDLIDLTGSGVEDLQVEITTSAAGHNVLYIHFVNEGRTLLRICRFKSASIAKLLK